MKTITIDQIMATNPCDDYTRESIMKWLPGKRPTLRVALTVALENIPVEDALRVLRALASDKQKRHFACDCAERALTLVGPKDERSWRAVKVARLYADGRATIGELREARRAASNAASNAAYAAAYAAVDAAAAAAAAAADAAAYAAGDAAAAAYAYAAGDAAAAAYAAARKSERVWQCWRMVEILEAK